MHMCSPLPLAVITMLTSTIWIILVILYYVHVHVHTCNTPNYIKNNLPKNPNAVGRIFPAYTSILIH